MHFRDGPPLSEMGRPVGLTRKTLRKWLALP